MGSILQKISENDIESLCDPQLLLILPLWRL